MFWREASEDARGFLCLVSKPGQVQADGDMPIPLSNTIQADM